MGKKRSAARRAAATAAAASAVSPSPAVPLDAHAAPVDTTTACDAEETLAKAAPQPRVSREADATRAPRAATPAYPTIDTTLVREPAIVDAHAREPVAIATPQTHERHASDPRPEPEDSPPALTTPSSTSSGVSANSPQQPHISNHADTLRALRAPFPALSIHAAADLATAVDRAGPPTVFFACPAHFFDRANEDSHEPETLAPRTRLATSIEEIDEELLENIIEDAQNATRIEARREIRVKALAEGRERGWKEGLEEGQRAARREARRDARADMLQQEQARRDAYELGRWDGYREGLEAARTEADSPIPPPDTFTAPSHVDSGVQFGAPPLPFPSRTHSPPPIPLDTLPATPHANAHVQTDDHVLALSPPIYACTTTSRVNPAIPRIDAGIQADAPAPPTRIHDTPSPRVHTGVQSDACGRPSTPPNKTYTTRPRVQASTQTDTPHSSAPAHARIVQEIEPGLLTDILAKAIARGEAAGLKKGKQVGFLDGMEAGWKSGTKEGHEDGYREGKQSGINEGREQHRLEVSRIPHAVAVVQTDYGPLPTRVDSASQTAAVAVVRRRTSTCHSQFPTTAHCNMNSSPATVPSTPNPTDLQQCTFISNATGNVNMPHDSLTTPSHIPLMSHIGTATFSWADDASSLPIRDSVLVSSYTPRDFSILRSSSHRPFDSLKRRARRSQTRPAHLSRPPRPLTLNSEPIVTRRHPAGLRADRPSVVVSSSPSISHPVKLEVPPLDWQGDPRLQELGRVLRGLGWVHGSAS